MSAKYWQRGETIDYTPTDDLANGDVVDLATRIGVAGNDIPAGETGAVHVVGGTRRRKTSPPQRAAARRTPRQAGPWRRPGPVTPRCW